MNKASAISPNLNTVFPEVLRMIFRDLSVDDVINLRAVDKELLARVTAAMRINMNAFARAYAYKHFKHIPERFEGFNRWCYAVKSLRCLEAKEKAARVAEEQRKDYEFGFKIAVMWTMSVIAIGGMIAAAKTASNRPHAHQGQVFDIDTLIWLDNTASPQIQPAYNTWLTDLSHWT